MAKIKEILGSETKLILVDFWTPWCVPCKILSPTIEQVKKEQGTNIKVIKVNADKDPELASELSVFSIPTIIFFKDGKEISRLIGIIKKEVIDTKIDLYK